MFSESWPSFPLAHRWPSMPSTVGEISCSDPPNLSDECWLSAATAIKGTGILVWAVCGRPLAGSISSRHCRDRGDQQGAPFWRAPPVQCTGGTHPPFYAFYRGLDLAGMADHVGIGRNSTMIHRRSSSTAFTTTSADAGGAHPRLQVIGGKPSATAPGGSSPGEGCSTATVEKICGRGRTFQSRRAQVAQIHLPHHIGEKVVIDSGGDDHRQSEFLVIAGSCRHIADSSEARSRGMVRVEVLGSRQVPAGFAR